MKYLICLVGLISLSSLVSAATINDIPSTDPAYPAIKKSVQHRYMSVFGNQNFRPNQPLSRKEMALIIDRLITTIDKKGGRLSTAQIQELQTLSRTFKSDIARTDIVHSKLVSQVDQLLTDQATIQQDLTAYQDETDQVIENKFWLTVGISTLIGIVTGVSL